MKDVFDILKGQKAAQQELADTLNTVRNKLAIIDYFVSDLNTSEIEDFDPEEIKVTRESLKYVNDTVTLILNNMDLESAIPNQPEGN